MREFREALATACDGDIIRVVKRGLKHKDIRVALDAAKFATLYLYGRPGLLEVRNGALTGFAASELTAERIAEAQAILTGEAAESSP